jgi:hypothetical protein
MKAAHAWLFADIAWSTDSVAAATRNRAAELGLEVVERPAWYDVDDPSALDRLLAENWRPRHGLQPYAAPFTMRALDRIGLRGPDLAAE